jgi:predicted secreted protein
LAAEAVRGDSPSWLIGVSALLAGGPIALALLRTVPNAVRLGRRTGSPAEQTRLARAVLRDHVLSAIGMALFVALWVLRSLT